MDKNIPLGEFVTFASLDALCQELVTVAWDTAEKAYCFQSNFPVGSAILAENDKGESRLFRGCNAENDCFPATICAERSAATTAITEGFTHFKVVVVCCRKCPGGSPCGLCRQFLNQFGRQAVLLNVVDSDKNVRRTTVGELLPGVTAEAKSVSQLSQAEQLLVGQVMALKERSYVPYSKNPRGALFLATNAKGKTKVFSGMACDNASYGASIAAENLAMYAARTEGYTADGLLIVTVKDVHAVNPIDGECLQVLREFGKHEEILLVGDDRRAVYTTLADLLPDSFGPESL